MGLLPKAPSFLNALKPARKETPLQLSAARVGLYVEAIKALTPKLSKRVALKRSPEPSRALMDIRRQGDEPKALPLLRRIRALALNTLKRNGLISARDIVTASQVVAKIIAPRTARCFA